MPEECTHDCSTCSLNCDSRKERPDTGIPESFLAPQNAYSTVRKVIAVVSGKGGVGKSLVTALAATEMKKRGYKTAILDADVTGPSIPKIFGLKEKADGTELGIIPVMTKNGIEVMSINLLLENESDPVVWRGPIIAGTVKQFWTDVLWNDVDYMFVDLPPGTGDVPLTVFQSLPVDGILVVTSPQELVTMIVGKAVKMASMMQVPVLGIVENMAYYECPDCGSRHNIFGESRLDEAAKKYDIPLTAQIPIDPEIAKKCDDGEVYDCKGEWLSDMTDGLIAMFDAADPHHRDPEKA
ncbi:MAG TPA: Mrp/NBP35 family ATP-binding protein [Oscillospiraceae bacterium]|nr:Mrp/NBP35 family ATP-binding protein [Oscillospiraceae bacterium]